MERSQPQLQNKQPHGRVALKTEEGDLSQYVKPVFALLSSTALLEKCVLGATQNQNKTFNIITWSNCPKTEFSSPATVQIAVNLALLAFNCGRQALSALLRHLGVQPSPRVENFLSMRDMTRLKRAEEKEEEVVKRRRKSQRAQKKSVEFTI